MLTQIRGEPKVETRESGLPKCAQKRLAQLRALVDDAEATRSNIQKRMGSVRPDETMDRAEIEKRRVANDKTLHYARALLNQVDDFLKKSGALAHFAPTQLKEAPTVKVGRADWGRIEELRKQVGDLKKEIKDVESAPLPFSMIEAQLKIIVNKWASEGEPHVTVDPYRGDVIAKWGAAVPSSFKIMAWLNRDAMLARLVEQAKRQAASKGEAMTPEQKSDILKSLRERLEAVELEEIALIDTLQEVGMPDAQHRLNVSPAALLGVREPRGMMKTALVA
jgi:hypothetical protein